MEKRTDDRKVREVRDAASVVTPAVAATSVAVARLRSTVDRSTASRGTRMRAVAIAGRRTS